MTKVSVIVPCYNQAQFISEALESVQFQSYNNWECIIVNDVGKIYYSKNIINDFKQQLVSNKNNKQQLVK